MKHVPLLPERPRPLIFAHRGCASLAPENTMASFKMARDIGAPGIELDIHAAADGRLVVAHDHVFTRTVPEGYGFNADGKTLESLGWDVIKTIDVGAAFGVQSPVQEKPAKPGMFAGEHPPQLHEVLEEFCPGMYVDIELKTRLTKHDPLPGLAADLIKRMGKDIAASVVVSSFNPFAVLAFKRFCPGVATAVIYCADAEVPWILRKGFGRIISNCDFLKPEYVQVTPFRVFGAKAEGRPIVPWTIDDPIIAKTMLGLGCDGVIGNRPQDMVHSIGK